MDYLLVVTSLNDSGSAHSISMDLDQPVAQFRYDLGVFVFMSCMCMNGNIHTYIHTGTHKRYVKIPCIDVS